MAHKQIHWSRFSAVEQALGTLSTLVALCLTIAPANSGEALRAGLRLTIPFAGSTIKTDDTTLSLNASKFSSHRDNKNDKQSNKIAYLSFINDGIVKTKPVSRRNDVHENDAVKPIHGVSQNHVRLVSAGRVYNRRARHSSRSYCASTDFPANARYAHARKRYIQANYCRAVQKHRDMLVAYRRYKRLHVKARPINTMPELAGGPVGRSQPKKSKNAYFDYWVARKAYQKALGDYHASLRSARKRQRRGWR